MDAELTAARGGRRFVQIATLTDKEGDPYILAVADDGTAWSASLTGPWTKLTALPND